MAGRGPPSLHRPAAQVSLLFRGQRVNGQTLGGQFGPANGVVNGVRDRVDPVSYTHLIGVAQPVSILVETFGTGTVADEVLEKAVRKTFDLRPTAIIRDLGLQKPIYRQLAAYGHMGREDLGVLWEKTDRAEQLKAACQ